MNTKSIRKNYIYNVSYQILTMITPLITAPYISRVLNADGIGIYSFSNAVVSVFVLFATIGTSLYGQREISYVRDDENKRSTIFFNVLLLRLISSSIVMVCYSIYLNSLKENKVLFGIVGLNILAVALDVSWFFQGLEEFGKIVLRNVIIKIVNIIFIFIFVKEKNDLIIYISGIVFLTIFSNLSLWPYLKKYIKKVPLKCIKPFNDLKVVFSLFVPIIAIQIYTVLDKAMIGFLTADAFENGYYEQAMKISKLTVTIVTSLGTVMIPRIGNCFELNQLDKIKDYMYRGFRFVFCLGMPLCFGLISIADNFVPWFFGEGYEPVINLLKITSLLIVILGISNLIGMQYLVPTKRENDLSKSVIVGAASNFFLNLLLIPLYGSLGAVIASVLAELAVTIVQLIMVRKIFSFKHILRTNYVYVLAGVVMFIIVCLISKYFTSSIFNTILLILVGASIYTITLIVCKDDFFLDNIKSIIKKSRLKK